MAAYLKGKSGSLRIVRDGVSAKVLEAETRAAQWLAEGNAAHERGFHEKAERCYDKAQYWLDRYNQLTCDA